MRKTQGFTLVELILVMVIIGILVAVSGDVITKPVKAYLTMENRASLTDNAELALRRMQRDIRRALPNSIRISNDGLTLEMLHTLDGGRYRDRPDISATSGAGLCAENPADDVLDFTGVDDCFEVMNELNQFNPQATSGQSLVIYNLGYGEGDAYTGSNRTTVQNSGKSGIIKFDLLIFPLRSPQQRFFIVDTPIQYRCDLKSGQLLRYSGYPINATLLSPPKKTTGNQLSNQVRHCRFSYAEASATRSGLVSLSLTLGKHSEEVIQLVQQIHVDNVP
ncbi:MAG: type II secretion system protein [Methylicorpusculum sp.]|uniref:PilW family protein n=1 Tax=Methylicorpusculum sp. TaxID=2713644 RepID=UPI00271A12C5|nr:type II secretion system protein [Methylicorpusculum sp.]MDO8940168.1 type II secretion system protein [Methylicorpusculum sp.]MDP2202205.1 type II secretion system protein [Methylicorpusculum sp.]